MAQRVLQKGDENLCQTQEDYKLFWIAEPECNKEQMKNRASNKIKMN